MVYDSVQHGGVYLLQFNNYHNVEMLCSSCCITGVYLCKQHLKSVSFTTILQLGLMLSFVQFCYHEEMLAGSSR